MVCSDFLIECKTATKEKASFSIKQDWINKVKEEAFAMNKKHWSIAFNFGGLDNKENFYIIDERLFISLKNYLEEEV